MMWRNFNFDIPNAPLLVRIGVDDTARECPVCGKQTLHWYTYPNPHRPQSRFNYIWCSECRLFAGSTVFSETWDLPDPLDAYTNEQRHELEADIGEFFALLDRLWESGELPQIRPDMGGAES